jgi:predicted nucleotidyltransferase
MRKQRRNEEMRVGNLEVPDEALRKICWKWKIRRLELFGSARTRRFGPDSDIDLLAEFEADEQWSLMDLARAQEEFSELLGRQADLVDRKNLERSPNIVRRDAILNSTEVIYAAKYRKLQPA